MTGHATRTLNPTRNGNRNYNPNGNPNQAEILSKFQHSASEVALIEMMAVNSNPSCNPLLLYSTGST